MKWQPAKASPKKPVDKLYTTSTSAEKGAGDGGLEERADESKIKQEENEEEAVEIDRGDCAEPFQEAVSAKEEGAEEPKGEEGEIPKRREGTIGAQLSNPGARTAW